MLQVADTLNSGTNSGNARMENVYVSVSSMVTVQRSEDVTLLAADQTPLHERDLLAPAASFVTIY